MERHWEDAILIDAAAKLIVNGDVEAGETLLTSSEITLRYGTSWWDGHDDYLYDVHITITTDPAGVPVLAAVGERLPAAFGGAVTTFRDAGGAFTRGILEEFDTRVGEVTIAPERLDQRRQDAAAQGRAIRHSRDGQADDADEAAAQFEPLLWPTMRPIDDHEWRTIWSHVPTMAADGGDAPIEAILYVRDGNWYVAARLAHDFAPQPYDEHVYQVGLAWNHAGGGLTPWKVSRPDDGPPILQIQINTSPTGLREISSDVEGAPLLLAAGEQLVEFLRRVAARDTPAAD